VFLHILQLRGGQQIFEQLVVVYSQSRNGQIAKSTALRERCSWRRPLAAAADAYAALLFCEWESAAQAEAGGQRMVLWIVEERSSSLHSCAAPSVNSILNAAH
jgi:hypothetical protein